MNEVFLGLGSNVGEKAENLRRAADWLAAQPRIRNFRMSRLYRTAPVGKLDQDWFVNAAARLETDLAPRALLEICREAERRLDRVRRERWGPRTLDVDILIFGGERVAEADLTIPHPRLTERAFALAPLAELMPGLEIAGKPVEAWLDLARDQKVERMEG